MCGRDDLKVTEFAGEGKWDDSNSIVTRVLVVLGDVSVPNVDSLPRVFVCIWIFTLSILDTLSGVRLSRSS